MATERPRCAYCSQTLRKGYVEGTYGYTGDGFYSTGSPFCSLRCGHRYAVRAVR